ncbi:MAG TPA: tetratricopeptide repeat protein [Anaerolineaceae bacterium]|nr:tetratricopeptide repeat protein [Anaerolineaceae bacterium]
MRESEFIEYLPASFDSELSHQIFSAFQKDPLIASSLDAQSLTAWQSIAAEKLRFWQPGLYALMSLDPSLVKTNLRDLANRVAPEYLTAATKVLQTSEIFQQGLEHLKDAVLLALLLRDYRQKNETWAEVSQFMFGIEGSLSYWETPALILSRIVPDFDQFVDTLLQETSLDKAKPVTRLVVHANEATAMPFAHRLEYLRALFELKPLETQVAGLEALKDYEPDEIIRNLANSFLVGHQIPDRPLDFAQIPVSKLPEIAEKLRMETRLFALAGKGAEAGILMSQASDALQVLFTRHLSDQAESLKYIAPEESAIASRQLASIKNFRQMNPWPSLAKTQTVSPFTNADLDSTLMALADQPDNPNLLRTYAELLLKNGQTEESVQVAQKAVNLGLNDPALITWFCAFPPRYSEFDENIQVIFDGLKLNPHDVALHLALANQFAAKSDKASSEETLEKLALEENLTAQDLFEISETYQHIGEFEVASGFLDRGSGTFVDSFTVEDFLQYFYAFLKLGAIEKASLLVESFKFQEVDKAACTLAVTDLNTLQNKVEHARESLLAIAPPENNKELSPQENENYLSTWGYYYRLARFEQSLGNLEAARRSASEAWKINQIAPESYLLMLELALEAADFKTFDSLHKLANERPLSAEQNSDLMTLFWVRSFVQNWSLPELALPEEISGTDLVGKPVFHLAKDSSFAWHKALEGIRAWFSEDWNNADSAFRLVLDKSPKFPVINLVIMNYLSEKMVARRNMRALHVCTHLPDDMFADSTDEATINTQLSLAGKYLPGEIISPVLRLSQAVVKGSWQRTSGLLSLINLPRQAATALSISQNAEISEQIAKSFPESPLVQLQFGLQLLRNKSSLAYKTASALIQNQSSDPLAHALAAYACLDDPKQSLTHLEAALSFWPDEPDWHAQAGIHLESLKNFTEAASHLEKAIQFDPENADYWQILGNIKVDEQDFEGAKEYFAKAVKRFPNNAKALENLALINQHMGQFAPAVASLQKAAILEPTTFRYREKLTQLYFDMGDFQAAIDEANRLLVDSENNSPAMLVKVKIYMKRRVFEEAQHLITRARSRVKDVIPFELAASEIEALSNKKNALIFSEKLLREFPDDTRVQKNHAKFQIEAGYANQAVETLQKCLYLNPTDPETMLLLGKAYAATKNLEGAIKYFSEAIAFEPGMIDALIGLGQIYQENRDLEKAIAYYEKALVISDTDPKPYHLAASVYREKKDYSKAELILKEAIQKFPSDLNLKGQLAAVMAINLVSNMQESTKRK